MMEWALRHAGFSAIRRFEEEELYSTYPEMPRKSEVRDSLLVTATAS
jgi:hypothetical protein